MILSSTRPANHHRLQAAGDSADQPRNRVFERHRIADNTPISHAVALGARRIYVLPTQNPGDLGLPRPPRAALAAAVHAVTVLTNARLHGDLARYAQSAELIVLPAANPGQISPTDFRHAGQLITWALTAARTALATGTPNPSAASVTTGLGTAGTLCSPGYWTGQRCTACWPRSTRFSRGPTSSDSTGRPSSAR